MNGSPMAGKPFPCRAACGWVGTLAPAGTATCSWVAGGAFVSSAACCSTATGLALLLAELDRLVDLHPRQHPDKGREGYGQDHAEHDVDLGDVVPGGHHHELGNPGVGLATD